MYLCAMTESDIENASLRFLDLFEALTGKANHLRPKPLKETKFHDAYDYTPSMPAELDTWEAYEAEQHYRVEQLLQMKEDYYILECNALTDDEAEEYNKKYLDVCEQIRIVMGVV